MPLPTSISFAHIGTPIKSLNTLNVRETHRNFGHQVKILPRYDVHITTHQSLKPLPDQRPLPFPYHVLRFIQP